MNIGRTIFAQLMEFLPWSTFDRIVARYEGNRGVRKLSCAAHYQIMAFAQLTYRESLRDIEACLSAQAAKLYHMGLREPVRRSTLADANALRDWRIYAEFAQRLIAQARRLYASESLGVDLANSVYALDSTTIADRVKTRMSAGVGQVIFPKPATRPCRPRKRLFQFHAYRRSHLRSWLTEPPKLVRWRPLRPPGRPSNR